MSGQDGGKGAAEELGREGDGGAGQPFGWARLAIGIGVVCYSLYALFELLMPGARPPLQETVVAAILLVAFVVARRRPAEAAAFTIALVWLEVTLTLVQEGELYSVSSVTYSVIVAVTGLVFRGTPTVLVTLLCLAALPASVFWHRHLRGAPLLAGREPEYLLSVELALVALAVITAAWRTANNRIRASIERSRRRYELLFEDAPDGLVELDAEGRVIDANPATMRLLGTERTALAGVNLNDALQRAGATSPVDVTSSVPAPPAEVELSSAAGQPRFLELTRRASSMAGAARSLLAIRDISERRNVQERLAHSQRLETVGLLAGRVAHDFNNLLTVVGGDATLLAESADASVRQLAAEIIEAQSRGVALTRQMLAFARHEGRHAVPLDVGEVARGAARLLSRALEESHTLRIDCPRPAPIEADRGQIEQVLLNLVANARDATPTGGTVTISIRQLPRAEAASLRSELDADDQVLVEVADEGTGMTPDTISHAFEPFFTTKPRGKGTGLGLSAVHGIVAQTGGQVVIDSSPGRGARIRMFFPRHDGDLNVSPRPIEPTPAAPGSAVGRILVVDDEPLVKAVTTRVLRSAGYEVVEASSGEMAVEEFFSSGPFDVLLTDVAMPGLSGVELAARLSMSAPDLEVVFLTGYVDVPLGPGLDSLPRSAGIITKPYRSADLLRVVHDCLLSRREHRAERAPDRGVTPS